MQIDVLNISKSVNNVKVSMTKHKKNCSKYTSTRKLLYFFLTVFTGSFLWSAEILPLRGRCFVWACNISK